VKTEWELVGWDELQRKLRGSHRRTQELASVALYQEANDIFNESQRVVPVRTGVLRASGHVTEPTRTSQHVEVIIGYGGAAASYALIVHENLRARHAPPTMAKYLWGPVTVASFGIEKRLLDRMHRIFDDSRPTGGPTGG
jgi:hypothetical protein